MLTRLSVLFCSCVASATAAASSLALEALNEQLSSEHASYLDNRRAAINSFHDPYFVAPKARIVEEKPREWDTERTPWRRNIRATVFWVGEQPTERNPTPNTASSWDPEWITNFGGYDHPEQRRGYLPASFVPQQTPFYIALPYNDLLAGGIGHKPEATEAIPWFSEDYTSPTKSVCHGKWLALHRNGRICYAMWRDAGPFTTDDWQYVFGNKRPQRNGNQNAGVDVSPAVRDYLSLSGKGLLDWKFVEDFEVPDGPWKTWNPAKK